ncbi:uncharacterized, partial [Tachysurus ichikawai]
MEVRPTTAPVPICDLVSFRQKLVLFLLGGRSGIFLPRCLVTNQPIRSVHAYAAESNARRVKKVQKNLVPQEEV